jgi:outer membrane protein assembly factor BamB
VGSDGSFYGYNGDSGLAVARSTPDGRIAWQSGDLSQGTGSGNVVALGPGDLVLDTISFPNGAPWAVIALDPATGAERWRYAQAQPGVVSPARVRPDGSIAVQSMGGPSNQLLILESTGTLRATIDLGALGATSAQLSAVNADGSFLLADLSTIFKVTASGELAWMSPAFAEPEGVLYAARGRVIVADGAFLKGLSPATGEVAWTVPLVSASGGVKDMTLASGGAIVVLQGDGTLFGASD